MRNVLRAGPGLPRRAVCPWRQARGPARPGPARGTRQISRPGQPPGPEGNSDRLGLSVDSDAGFRVPCFACPNSSA